MTSKEQRYLIVNADDFGLSDGINRGIIEAHEHGIVTSASLMVRYPAAAGAAAYARQRPQLSVGLHFDIAEWRYRNGQWEAAYQVVNPTDAAAVRDEVRKQLNRFEELLRRAPTHLDSHQHVHKSEPARSILIQAARDMQVPLRDLGGIRYEGNYYGQTSEGEPFPEGIRLARLRKMIANLEGGWTEIGCHPGYAEELDSVYRHEREEEVRVLCNSGIPTALKKNEIRVVSFNAYLDKNNAPPVFGAGGA